MTRADLRPFVAMTTLVKMRGLVASRQAAPLSWVTTARAQARRHVCGAVCRVGRESDGDPRLTIPKIACDFCNKISAHGSATERQNSTVSRYPRWLVVSQFEILRGLNPLSTQLMPKPRSNTRIGTPTTRNAKLK